MCTISFIPKKKGFLLGMNRDESIQRPIASKPEIITPNGVKAVSPSDPAGGTWILANEFGLTHCLLNWYPITPSTGSNILSRGTIPLQLSGFHSLEASAEALKNLPLKNVNPFRLITLSLGEQLVSEFRWDRIRLESQSHQWRDTLWASSGYDEPGAQQFRSQVFKEALVQKSKGTTQWLRRLHRSRKPEFGAFSINMRRNDAATVSYTELSVIPSQLSMSYQSGQPSTANDFDCLSLPICSFESNAAE
jgi:hypothetical protein